MQVVAEQMRMLLADDHPIVLEAFSQHLLRAFPGSEQVLATSLPEVAALIEAGSEFDLVVMDYRMPGMGETFNLPDMVAEFAPVPVAVISGVAETADVRDILASGVRGFIPKTMNSEAIGAALSVILAGGSFVPAELSMQAQALQDKIDKEPTPGHDLTPREWDVLQELGKGATNKNIARALKIQEVTVKLHVQRVLEKLGAKNRSEAAIIAIRQGMIADVV